MLEQSQIRQILADILESPEFKESQRYRELLQFLVEESIAGRSPKETTIGTQIFGKDPSFNSKEDATVRVYINNLRKKLEHYYLTAGKTAPFKLNIPVGHYKVEFVPTKEKSSKQNTNKRTFVWGLLIAGSIGTFLLGYYSSSVFQSNPKNPGPPNSIWNEFVQPNGRPTLVVLGDYFFLREINPVSSYYRTITINNPEDLQEKLAKDPAFAKRYKQNEFTFLRPSSTWGLTQVIPILQKSPRGYSLKLASEVTPADFKSNNIVFIGTLKTLYSFSKFLHIFGMQRTATPYESIALRSEKGDSVQTFGVGQQLSTDYVKDYSIIAKGAGPEGSTILMLLGFTENGAIAAPRAASESSLLKAIAQKFPNQVLADPFYFTLVIATEGISDAVFKSEILYFLQNEPHHSFTGTGEEDSTKAR
ncbi:MAG: helix-turn-helix domain-containing protein [Ignavibacteria bacterium]|nr:helix-turn-helix domain-containing protein [Ignavibacteria bacterium]